MLAWAKCGLARPEGLSRTTTSSVYDFVTAPWAAMSREERLRICFQTLEGLQRVHDAGWIHGNIRPAALGVFGDTSSADSSTVRAVIKDNTSAAPGPCRYDKPRSDGPEVAPEVWTSSEESPYSFAADIFSLAVCWIRVLEVPLGAVPKTTRQAHRVLCNAVLSDDGAGVIGSEFHELVLSMLEMDPSTRPCMQKLLAHEAWSLIRDPKI